MDSHKRVRALISLDAVRHNFDEMHRVISPETKIIAVVKADAYGHGAVRIAHWMEDVDYIWGFAVACADEAAILKKSGIRKPVLILGPVFEDSMEDLAQMNVRIPITDYQDAAAYAKAGAALNRPVHVHIAIDTGMSRIGFPDTSQTIDEIRKIMEIPGLCVEGMFTHFARADESDPSFGTRQLERFQNFADQVKKAGIRIPFVHCSNSAGIIRMPQANMNLVRAGITIYGIYPSEEVERDIISLKPVMSLESHVTFVKKVLPGTEVSYGGTWTAECERILATVPVGYADGYPRLLSNKGWVLIHGQKAPIRGRVCMDQFMVDVTDIPDVKRGDRVVLLGSDGGETITADMLGGLSGRFSYEFVCDINPRVPRIYIDADRSERS